MEVHHTFLSYDTKTTDVMRLEVLPKQQMCHLFFFFCTINTFPIIKLPFATHRQSCDEVRSSVVVLSTVTEAAKSLTNTTRRETTTIPDTIRAHSDRKKQVFPFI